MMSEEFWCLRINIPNETWHVADILFLVGLTSSVFIVSEIKKLIERTLKKRVYGKYAAKAHDAMDFVWHESDKTL